jgi:hypothetical protein
MGFATATADPVVVPVPPPAGRAHTSRWVHQRTRRQADREKRAIRRQQLVESAAQISARRHHRPAYTGDDRDSRKLFDLRAASNQMHSARAASEQSAANHLIKWAAGKVQNFSDRAPTAPISPASTAAVRPQTNRLLAKYDDSARHWKCERDSDERSRLDWLLSPRLELVGWSGKGSTANARQQRRQHIGAVARSAPKPPAHAPHRHDSRPGGTYMKCGHAVATQSPRAGRQWTFNTSDPNRSGAPVAEGVLHWSRTGGGFVQVVHKIKYR